MILDETKLVAIVGPTGSGKTGLAIDLAEKYGGEIVCADSRTIYRGTDIGTAKPTAGERARVPHHLLDVADPDETYSAQQFKDAAFAAIEDIAARGKVPFLVGGSGLYVYAVVYDFMFPAGARSEERARLEALPLVELVKRLRLEDPERAAEIDLKNPRRVIRALETVGMPREQLMRKKSKTLLLGIKPDEGVLNTRIAQRTNQFFQMGLVDEVKNLSAKYGTEIETLKGVNYTEIISFLAGKISREEAEELMNLHQRQLVRRQMTWFRRNPEIQWVSDADKGLSLVDGFLAS